MASRSLMITTLAAAMSGAPVARGPKRSAVQIANLEVTGLTLVLAKTPAPYAVRPQQSSSVVSG